MTPLSKAATRRRTPKRKQACAELLQVYVSACPPLAGRHLGWGPGLEAKAQRACQAVG